MEDYWKAVCDLENGTITNALSDQEVYFSCL